MANTHTTIYHQLKSPAAHVAMEQFAFNEGLRFLVEQCCQDSQRWFPRTAEDLTIFGLGVAGEAGEVADWIKKIARGSHKLEDVQHELATEIVDVLIYICNLMGHLPEEIDWAAIWHEKRAFNEERFGKTAE